MKLNTKRLKIRSLTTTATARTDDDVLLVSDAGGSWTLTLPPSANCINKVLQIKKTNSSSNTVTVDGNGSETIDGATTFAMKTQYEVLQLVSDGNNWHVIFSNAGLLEAETNSHLRTIRGWVFSGATTLGEGFTATNTSANLWQIAFTKPFDSSVTALANACYGSLTASIYTSIPYDVTTTGFKVYSIITSGVTAAGSAPFSFIAIGRK